MEIVTHYSNTPEMPELSGVSRRIPGNYGKPPRFPLDTQSEPYRRGFGKLAVTVRNRRLGFMTAWSCLLGSAHDRLRRIAGAGRGDVACPDPAGRRPR